MIQVQHTYVCAVRMQCISYNRQLWSMKTGRTDFVEMPFSSLRVSIYFRYSTHFFFWIIEVFNSKIELNEKWGQKMCLLLPKAVIRLFIVLYVLTNRQYVRRSSLNSFPPCSLCAACVVVRMFPIPPPPSKKAEALKRLTDEGICREGSLSCVGTSFQVFGGSPLGIFAVGPGRRLGMIVRSLPSVGILVVFYRYTRDKVLHTPHYDLYALHIKNPNNLFSRNSMWYIAIMLRREKVIQGDSLSFAFSGCIRDTITDVLSCFLFRMVLTL